MDVIVNTASRDKNLTKGNTSFALLTKAGHQMQDEIHRAPLMKHVIITKGYDLECTEVFHTFCVSKGEHASQQVQA